MEMQPAFLLHEATRAFLAERKKIANDTRYGLGARIGSNDLSTVCGMIPILAAGTVWVNCHAVIDGALPSGGMRHTGFSREQGRAAIDRYTESKSVMVNDA